MKCSICDVELPCLDIFGFYLLLWPGHYTSRVSVDGPGMGVDALDLEDCPEVGLDLTLTLYQHKFWITLEIHVQRIRYCTGLLGSQVFW